MAITAYLGETNIDYVGDTDPLQRVYTAAGKIHDMLVSRNIPEPGASYATYQAYFETGAFTSTLYLQHNNASGIKYAKQKGAIKGANGYAYWPGGLDGWADAFVHEITKGTDPVDAKSLEDYVTRLKANKYMEASASDYLSGLQRARLVLKVIPAADRASVQADSSVQDRQDMDIPGTVDYSKESLKDKWDKLPEMEKVGIGVGAGLALLLILRD